jgi:hypothetical protein
MSTCDGDTMYLAYAKLKDKDGKDVDGNEYQIKYKDSGEQIENKGRRLYTVLEGKNENMKKPAPVIINDKTYKVDLSPEAQKRSLCTKSSFFGKNKRVFDYIEDTTGGRRRTRRRHGKRKRSTKRKHTSKRKQSTRRRKSCKRRR